MELEVSRHPFLRGVLTGLVVLAIAFATLRGLRR